MISVPIILWSWRRLPVSCKFVAELITVIVSDHRKVNVCLQTDWTVSLGGGTVASRRFTAALKREDVYEWWVGKDLEEAVVQYLDRLKETGQDGWWLVRDSNRVLTGTLSCLVNVLNSTRCILNPNRVMRREYLSLCSAVRCGSCLSTVATTLDENVMKFITNCSVLVNTNSLGIGRKRLGYPCAFF
jgi:hypothetical protein